MTLINENERVSINRIGDHVGREVALQGWVYNKRSSGKIRFLLVRDGTGVIQGVMGKKDVPADVFDRFDNLTQESSIVVTGVVRKDDRAVGGSQREDDLQALTGRMEKEGIPTESMMVSRPAPLRVGAPFRIQPGTRTGGVLDCRVETRA